MSTDDNPFCPRCGFRTFPQWGAHDCALPFDTRLMRHTAGNILSNLHFYRIPAGVQIAALIEALAYTIGANLEPTRLPPILEATGLQVTRLATEESDRVKAKTANDNPVMEITRSRLKAKKGKPVGRKTEKAYRSNRKVVQTRRTRQK